MMKDLIHFMREYRGSVEQFQKLKELEKQIKDLTYEFYKNEYYKLCKHWINDRCLHPKNLNYTILSPNVQCTLSSCPFPLEEETI